MVRAYEVERKKRIDSITNSLKVAKKAKSEIDWEKLIIMVMAEYSVSRRTSREYIFVAKVKAGIK